MAIVDTEHTFSVDEEYKSPIIPERHTQLSRRVVLSGEAKVHGGVFGNTISIEAGNIEVMQSMYSPSDVTVRLAVGGHCLLRSALVARRSLLVDSDETGRLRIGGMVYTRDARIENARIYGSIIAESLVLKNSLVLGEVLVRNKVSMTGCFVGSFKAGHVTIEGKGALWMPYGAAREGIELNGQLLCHPLRDYESAHANVSLSQNDIKTVTHTNQITGESETLQVISVNGRVLDTEEINACMERSQQEHLHMCQLLEENRLDELSAAEDALLEPIRS